MQKTYVHITHDETKRLTVAISDDLQDMWVEMRCNTQAPNVRMQIADNGYDGNTLFIALDEAITTSSGTVTDSFFKTLEDFRFFHQFAVCCLKGCMTSDQIFDHITVAFNGFKEVK